ncbi:MAG: hypothetical protein OXF98_10245 [Rhodospirillaceae bacterium]|nr:hypothetical protein [Rhodospirillaceae bacterium]
MTMDVSFGTTVEFTCYPEVRELFEADDFSFLASYTIYLPPFDADTSIIGSFDAAEAERIRQVFIARKANGLNDVPFGELLRLDRESSGPLVRIRTPIANFEEVWPLFETACTKQ